jgi:DNA polymerase-3 subunit delta'
MKEYIIENQSVFYKVLDNSFTANKKAHAYLLVGNNTYIPAKYLAMSLICDEILACEECNDCRKVKEDKYSDIIHFDGKKETIKKKNIAYIQEQFKKSSLEGKAKIYIIEDIQNATIEAMNTLLKILEEPTSEIYAIFTTSNKDSVLPTIVSRCLVIDIKPDSKKVLKKRLLEKGIEQQEANVLSQLVQSVEEAEMLRGEQLDFYMVEVINTIDDIFNKPDNLAINMHINLLQAYKDKNDIRLFLNMLVLGLKDLFHVKHFQELTYVNQKKIISSINAPEGDIIEKIELVLEANYHLDSNANILLLMDSLLYRL